MKVRAPRAELAQALAWVAAALPKRPSHAAMSGVRITARNGELTLRCYDYETSHAARVNVECIDDGEVLVTAWFLREVVSSLSAATVELVADDTRLSITAGRSAYRVALLDLADYPKLPDFPAVVGSIPTANLAGIVGVTAHAAARDEALGVLTGVHLAAEGDHLAAMTTDRYRIARCHTGWDGQDFAATVPVRAMLAALKGMGGMLEVGYADGQVGIRDDTRTVTTRLLAGDFPQVARFLDLPAADSLTVAAGPLAEASKRATLAAEDYNVVRLTVSEGEVEVTSASDVSDGAEYVECESTGSVVVGFNGTYLADALTAADSATVRIGFSGDSKPVSVTPLDHDNIALVVMPRREK